MNGIRTWEIPRLMYRLIMNLRKRFLDVLITVPDGCVEGCGNIIFIILAFK
jgi:hypothetical protein